jgi:outer membrane protein TolC
MRKTPRPSRRTVGILLVTLTSLGCAASRQAQMSKNQEADSNPSPPIAKSNLQPSDAAHSVPSHTANIAGKAASSDESVSEVTLVVAEDGASDIRSAGTDGGREIANDRAPTVTAPIGSGSTAPTSYPVDLGGVLAYAEGKNPQVSLARERIREAYAQVDQADILWLPTLRAGLNYNQHQGAIQNVAGNVFNTNRNAFYGGLGAGAVGASSPSVPGLMANFHLTDAIFQPKIARYQATSKQFAATTARNDVLCDTAIAYLELLRTEHRLAIAREARDKTQRIAELTGAYARTGQGSIADHDRLLTELAARDGDIAQAEELVQTSSTRLAFLIHADPTVSISTNEPFVAPLNFMAMESTIQDLVAQGLTHRPELAEHRQLVGEACERLRREQYAPLIPSVLLGMSYGSFGGGIGNSTANTSDRLDADAIAYWEVRNLGFGERAIRNEANSKLEQARWRQVIILDRVAQEVVETHAQVASRRKRIDAARPGIESAERSYVLNLQRIENAKGLPIEALQSVQALAQARRDYLNAVIDHNVAQVRLCRATGWFEDLNATNPEQPRSAGN